MAQPGPIHDNALKHLAALDLVAVCRLVGVDASADDLRLSESLTATTQYADLIAITTSGVAHIEFQTRAQAGLGLRMLEYRARIMRNDQYHGRPLRQHVLILGRGEDPGVITDRDQLTLRYGVHYLRNVDPGALLANAATAPLAPLGRAHTGHNRSDLLRQALAVIRRNSPVGRADELGGLAANLASLYLDAVTIRKVWEDIMPIDFRDNDLARSFIEEGRKVGRQEGQRDTFRRMLRARFGDDPRVDEIAARLVNATDEEIASVLNATDLDAL